MNRPSSDPLCRLDQFDIDYHHSLARPPSSFDHSHLVPEGTLLKLKDIPVMPVVPFGAAAGQRPGSQSPTSVFDDTSNPPPHTANGIGANLNSGLSPHDEAGSYDLKPPPPTSRSSSLEDLAPLFFSVDHLNIILHDQRYSRIFASFLQNYRPHLLPVLAEYLDIQKAISAIEYANSLAETLSTHKSGHAAAAAFLNDDFEAKAQQAAEQLLEEALQPFLTHRLAHITTDTLVKEITGQSTPLMRDMIPSLAEVYCLSDPSLPDNPIVYASEEFYNTSQYNKDYCIGRNCRFLQGPKTSHQSVRRLAEALAAGQELNETVLNYRRDGTPFLNLLLIAPLYDNKGAVRYFLGAQIDVSSLVRDGRGFESFERLLLKDRVDSRLGHRQSRKSIDVLSELSAILSTDELTAMKNAALRIPSESGRSTPNSRATWHGRRILGMEDDHISEKGFWPDRSLGSSGRLPGVYQNYLLVRPYPSLRITFTSPALRIPGLIQTKLMDRIEGPPHVKEGMLEALSHGTSVTAKIKWLPLSGGREGGEGRQRWLHCTPLFGSDDNVGVWMVVMVEKEEVTGRLSSLTIDSQRPTSSRPNTRADDRHTSERLYQDYLKRQGKGHKASDSGYSVD